MALASLRSMPPLTKLCQARARPAKSLALSSVHDRLMPGSILAVISDSTRLPSGAIRENKAITAYAKDMRDFLNESELTERRAFIESFVKEIVVMPGDALMRYTVPMPDDSLIPGRAAEKVALNGSVLSTVKMVGRGVPNCELSGGRSPHKSRSIRSTSLPPHMSYGLVSHAYQTTSVLFKRYCPLKQ